MCNCGYLHRDNSWQNTEVSQALCWCYGMRCNNATFALEELTVWERYTTLDQSAENKYENNPRTKARTSCASQGEMHFRSESQEQVHGYLETDFVSLCLVADIFINRQGPCFCGRGAQGKKRWAGTSKQESGELALLAVRRTAAVWLLGISVLTCHMETPVLARVMSPGCLEYPKKKWPWELIVICKAPCDINYCHPQTNDSYLLFLLQRIESIGTLYPNQSVCRAPRDNTQQHLFLFTKLQKYTQMHPENATLLIPSWRASQQSWLLARLYPPPGGKLLLTRWHREVSELSRKLCGWEERRDVWSWYCHHPSSVHAVTAHWFTPPHSLFHKEQPQLSSNIRNTNYHWVWE